MKKSNWEKAAANILKFELKRRGLTYNDLQVALSKIGVQIPAQNLNKTINLGKFSFAFFLQCAQAIGLSRVEFDFSLLQTTGIKETK